MITLVLHFGMCINDLFPSMNRHFWNVCSCLVVKGLGSDTRNNKNWYHNQKKENGSEWYYFIIIMSIHHIMSWNIGECTNETLEEGLEMIERRRSTPSLSSSVFVIIIIMMIRFFKFFVSNTSSSSSFWKFSRREEHLWWGTSSPFSPAKYFYSNNTERPYQHLSGLHQMDHQHASDAVLFSNGSIPEWLFTRSFNLLSSLIPTHAISSSSILL